MEISQGVLALEELVKTYERQIKEKVNQKQPSEAYRLYQRMDGVRHSIKVLKKVQKGHLEVISGL